MFARIYISFIFINKGVMKTEQRLFTKDSWCSSNQIDSNSQLVLAFASPSLVKEESSYNSLKKFFPKADIVLVWTAWEIHDIDVMDDSISVSALFFENTPIKVFEQEANSINDSLLVWEDLAKKVSSDKSLQYVVTFIDWLWISWDYFLQGLKNILNKDVWITWGLAWDWFDPWKTYVSLNGIPKEKNVAVIIWFYGDSIRIWNASRAWFDTFGVERMVTKSVENTVFELDNEPILDLYKRYLWEQAKHLPGSAVNFPINIYPSNERDGILRSVLTVSDEQWSISFSWTVPQWYKAFLMKTNFSKLIQESWKAASLWLEKNPRPIFALLVSCAGRRIILKQRVEDEIDIIRETVWDSCAMAGFYSYWEIWINTADNDYYLHNETMTIALFSEE